jgi:hypothetical protein
VESEDLQDMPTLMDMDDIDGNHEADDGTEDGNCDGKAKEVQPNLHSDKSDQNPQICCHPNDNQGSHGGKYMAYYILALEWALEDDKNDGEGVEEMQQHAEKFSEEDMRVSVM